MATRVLRARGRVVSGDGAPLAGALVALADRDLVLDDLLGAAETDAEGRFRVAFARESFNREPLEGERTPDLYAVVSLYDDGGWVPVLRRDFAASFEGGECDLGSVHVPWVEGRAPLRLEGVDPLPGRVHARAKAVAPDGELLAAALAEAAAAVEGTTGWSGLLDGVEVVFDDAVDREKKEAAMAARLGVPREWMTFAPSAGPGVLGWYDHFTRQVVVVREAAAGYPFEMLVSALAHELVHVGQYGRHPELFEEEIDIFRASIAHARTFEGPDAYGAWAAGRWREAPSLYEFERTKRASWASVEARWFRLRANVESFARYVQWDWLPSRDASSFAPTVSFSEALFERLKRLGARPPAAGDGAPPVGDGGADEGAAAPAGVGAVAASLAPGAEGPSPDDGAGEDVGVFSFGPKAPPERLAVYTALLDEYRSRERDGRLAPFDPTLRAEV
jgi:hypothetical protein